jgi:hypothetical protein
MSRGKKRIEIENVRVPTNALAAVLGVSIATVSKFIFEPIKNESQEYYLHDVLRCLWGMRRARHDETPDGELSIQEAKRLKTIEEHRKLKLANDLEDGELIEMAEVERTIRAFLDPAMREAETFLLNKLPAEAANLDAGEIRNLMTPAYNAWVASVQNMVDELCGTESTSDES